MSGEAAAEERTQQMLARSRCSALEAMSPDGGRILVREQMHPALPIQPRRLAQLTRERGQALVEFVLILPIFMLLIFGVIEFGKALNYWIDTTHLANEGARYAAVNRWPSCPDDDTTPCAETLKDYLVARANTAELASGGTSNVPTALKPGVRICFPEGAPTVGKAVRVTVKSTYKLAVVNGMFGLVGLSQIGDIELSSSSTLRLERAPTPNRLLAESSACPA